MSVHVETKGPVWTVVIDRPERRNAVDRRTATELADAFRSFESDGEASAAVLWGAGGTFCAGADLKAFAAGKGNAVQVEGDAPMGPTRMVLSKPVIAAVSGFAVAGGLELALWCDLRVAEEDAVFGVFSRRWGVPLIDGGTVRLARHVGQGRALDMILTGRPVEAGEALVWGLCDRVVPVGDARARAEALAHEIARFPRACLHTDRRSARGQWGLPEAEAMAREFASGVEVLEAAREGAARFAAGAGRHGTFEEDPPSGA